jgi:hypothetical protein
MEMMSACPSTSICSAVSGGVDAVAGDQRNAELSAQATGDLGKGGAGHAGGNCRNLRLVPGEVCADDVSARGLDGLGEGHHLFPAAAIGHHFHAGQAESQDKLLPQGGAYTADDLDGKAHAVGVASTPAVGALIGFLQQEAADEVTRRTNNLNTVITRLLGQLCAVDNVIDGLLYLVIGELVGHKAADG